jgi:hypothetical protein
MYRFIVNFLLLVGFIPLVLADSSEPAYAVDRLWEYSYSEFLDLVILEQKEIDVLKQLKPIKSTELLLTINGIKPSLGSDNVALYRYRCENYKINDIVYIFDEKPYLLAFTLPEDIAAGISILNKYIDNSEVKEFDVSNKELLLELKLFLTSGGYPSNKCSH